MTPHTGPIASRLNLPPPAEPHQAFTYLPGLPERDDPELVTLMTAVAALDREGLEETVRCLLMCSLAQERNGNADHLVAIGPDALVTFRLRAARLAETPEG